MFDITCYGQSGVLLVFRGELEVYFTRKMQNSYKKSVVLTFMKVF